MTTPDSSPRPSRLKKARQGAFLDAFMAIATVTGAARQVGIAPKTHYRWLQRDKKYVEAFAEAETIAVDRLEQEARRRALVGVEEPVFGRVARDQDGEIGRVRKYSDTLLIFLLKGARPEKYRERFEHTGASGAPLTFTLKLKPEVDA